MELWTAVKTYIGHSACLSVFLFVQSTPTLTIQISVDDPALYQGQIRVKVKGKVIPLQARCGPEGG